MELKTNAKCQLIVDGSIDIPEDGYSKIEVIIAEDYPDNFYIIENRTTETIVYDMPADGMYVYYMIDGNLNDEKPQDFIKYLVSDPTNMAKGKKSKLFSICKLRNCLLQLEKEAIEEFVNTCQSGNCHQKSQHKQHRDLLLIAIFLLENLICQERYSEASMILTKLSTCGDICGNQIITRKCNC